MSVNKSPFTILIVDDKTENRISLEAMLADENRIFIHAANGNEALRQVLKHEEIGLIMLDVQMPDMDGFEVASLIRNNPRTRHLSIIFVTAINKETPYVLKGFEEGAVDYLSKPLDVPVTRAKVNVFERLYGYQQELKQALSEKQRVNEQLERFMYVVAYDLKSPLAGISSLLDYIRTFPAISGSAELTTYMDMCSDAAGHLGEMIHAILEYARSADFGQRKETVQTGELARQVANLLYPPPHITIQINDGLPSLHTNRLKLQQVLQNLLSNAIKHNDKKQGVIEVGVTGPQAGYYEFYVKDNGPGIAKEDQARIFHLFETAGKGRHDTTHTGIGLNLSKMFVEEQGGSLGVRSEPGNGSTFYFTWPA